MASIADWHSETRPLYRALFGLALLVFGGLLLLGFWASFRVWGTPPSPIFDPIALAKKYFLAGDLEGAARELRTASLVYYLAVDATAELAEVYRRTGDRDATVRLHEARVAMRPFEVEPRFSLGLAQLSAGRTAEGTATLEMILWSVPGYPRIHEALAHAYLGADRLAEAEAVLREGLKTDPFSASLHEQLAATLTRLGNAEDAERELARAARLRDPSQGPVHEVPRDASDVRNFAP